MAEKDNTFQNTVEALFRGMDSFITTKTVVGEAIHIDDTILLPLVDVSFGVGAVHSQKMQRTMQEAVWAEKFLRAPFLSSAKRNASGQHQKPGCCHQNH